MIEPTPVTTAPRLFRAPLPPPDARRWIVERALHRVGTRWQIHPVVLRSLLLTAALAPIRAAFDRPAAGPVRLGAGPGTYRLVRLGGLRLLLPPEGGPGADHVDPRYVTLVQRGPLGGVRVRAGVAFGRPGMLKAAARIHALPPAVGMDAVQAVRMALGAPRLSEVSRTPTDWLTPVLRWAQGCG